jgi:acyl-CoA thioester hydrolase
VSANISECRAHTPTSSPQGGGEQGVPYSHLSGTIRENTHVLPLRVYYEDTDFSGFCYHGSYVRFLERGRTELLRMARIHQSDLHEADGVSFVVRRMSLDYRRPARMDDILTVETTVREMRGATMLLAQAVLRGGDILVSAEVTVAAVKDGRAARIPESVRAAFREEPAPPPAPGPNR